MGIAGLDVATSEVLVGSVLKHAALEYVDARAREALIEFIEEGDVVLNVRELTKDLGIRDVSAFLSFLNEALGAIFAFGGGLGARTARGDADHGCSAYSFGCLLSGLFEWLLGLRL